MKQEKFETIDSALQALQAGEVVAIPTETVYGLAADITIDRAVQKIFALKKRPTNHPLIIHISNEEQLHLCASHVPDYATALIKKFWPGPLTLILPKTTHVSDWVTGGQSSVGIRMPAHPIAHTLIERLNHPLAAPSANIFGHLSPSTAAHVYNEFGGELKILDGGPCNIGIESTIIDATQENSCCILREGHITAEEIAAVIQPWAQLTPKPIVEKRVSGNLKKHYAPRKALFLFSTKAELEIIISKHRAVCILAHSKEILPTIPMPNDPKNYAQVLYQQLHLADSHDCSVIALENVPKTAGWGAVRDRLQKAAAS